MRVRLLGALLAAAAALLVTPKIGYSEAETAGVVSVTAKDLAPYESEPIGILRPFSMTTSCCGERPSVVR